MRRIFDISVALKVRKLICEKILRERRGIVSLERETGSRGISIEYRTLHDEQIT